MDKQAVIDILNSIRTNENSDRADELVHLILSLDEEAFNSALHNIGDEDEVKLYLQRKLQEIPDLRTVEHIPINGIFAYGITRRKRTSAFASRFT